MLQSVISVGSFLVAHHQELVMGLMTALSGMIAIALIIPGDQPEKTLQKVVDVLTKISRK